ncbi:MAG TPA: APC family permease [Thermoleophilaceae bacterium]|nr:APC family permease [Thermoleophilaceae bacterium]
MNARFVRYVARLEPLRAPLRPFFASIEGRLARAVGTPAIYAIAIGAIGASIYISLGIVADFALGLTPVAYLAAGVFFVVTMLTYVEANSLHPERGGASTFARYAFDELWSFIAGWGIVLDYLIVMALCAFAVPDYLAAFWGHAGDRGVEHAIAAGVILWAVLVNLRGLRADQLGLVLRLGTLNVILLIAVVAIGAASLWDLDAVTDGVDLGTSPEWDDLAFAAVIAGLALTGLEAASGVAGEIRPNRKQMSRVIGTSSATAFLVLIGISLVGLMALPVVGGETPLGEDFHEAPLLGVVSSYDWLDQTLRYAVGAMAALVLVQATTANMMGVSRLAYSLATNRQIPSAVGRLDPRRSTPWVAISVCGLLAFGLVLTSDLDFLAGTFAFGATLAFAIAHASVIRLRFREATARRPYRMPLSISVRGGSIPLPAALGLVMAVAAWVSVVVLHEGARYAGAAWLVGGLLLYVIYRRGQDKPLRKRFTIPAAVLQERGAEIEYGSILVPVFGSKLDDDIIGTAGRLAAEEAAEGEGGTVIEAIYVLEIPMSLPIDARVPDEQIQAAKAALRRAKEVGEEYAGVEVAPATARARSLGAGIVDEARRRGVEAIVLAAEEPTRMRGGSGLGGRSGPRDRYVGEMTRYVVEKAPCRVILTAPPAGEVAEREGVQP